MNICTKHHIIILFFSISTALIGCKPTAKRVKPYVEEKPLLTKEQSISINKFWVQDESYRIDRFITRHNWPAVKTESAIRYWIFCHGKGEKIESGDRITIDFKVRLMDADTTLCYSSQTSGPQTFLVNKDYVESGIHEAVTYMHVGDKAFVLLPHILAYGLLGDNDKIPPLSALLYEIEVLSVIKA